MTCSWPPSFPTLKTSKVFTPLKMGSEERMREKCRENVGEEAVTPDQIWESTDGVRGMFVSA